MRLPTLTKAFRDKFYQRFLINGIKTSYSLPVSLKQGQTPHSNLIKCQGGLLSLQNQGEKTDLFSRPQPFGSTKTQSTWSIKSANLVTSNFKNRKARPGSLCLSLPLRTEHGVEIYAESQGGSVLTNRLAPNATRIHSGTAVPHKSPG